MRALLGGLVCLAVVTWTEGASAQTQIKPYFMVIFDDSGSMGDSTGPGNNSCGEARTKLNDAKCALQRVLDAFGDVTFGLTSFKQYGTGSNVHVDLFEDNQADILSWIDFGGTPELSDGGVTPIRDALDDVRFYYRAAGGPIATDPARGCRPYFVILLHDGDPCCDGRNNLTNSIAAAEDLRTTAVAGGGIEDIRTYVIYFGTSAASLGRADQIADGGGTTAAQQATNEEQLAIAFNNIIADSLLTEVCDGADNDCDTLVDEGFQLYCDRDNRLGMGATSMNVRCADPGDDCDDSDDNCFMSTDDETPRNACGTCGAAPAEVCDRIDNNCNGLIDEGDVCMGCTPTGAEVCDNADNDCDTRIDEGLTRPCGSSVGECSPGLETCTAGAWGGCTATGGSMEICDGLDNDCNGVIDGLSRSCGTDEGACRAGVQICTDGGFGPCLGRIGPGDEVCDGEDNDCDGMVDEEDPFVGDACGTDTGECMPGMIDCVDGALECVGAVGPTMEICDDLDNDCDGVVDDGLGVGAPCGSDEGICSPGLNVCVDGEIVCEGEIGAAEEVCNELDDDCDGRIDEMLPVGVACGSEEGLCMEGVVQCVDGREICVGEVPPTSETCDCEDNDCDGAVDETPEGPLCPEGSACVDCQCALPCGRTEFGFTCPTGRAPRVEDDECFCVSEGCQAEACGMQTIERDGDVLCSPDGNGCVCKNNECTFPCDGVVCMEGLVCDPRSGICAEDSCRGLGCPDGELCDVTTGECETDPCVGTDCGADACRDGECVGSCAEVDCSEGELCRSGECVDDPCAGSSCDDGEVCDPSDGSCVEDMCGDTRCPTGSVCDPVSGECELDPCTGLTCPDGQECVEGECELEMVIEPDAGPMPGADAGPMGPGPNGSLVLATGGGGCACAAAGVPEREVPKLPLSLTLGLFGLVLLRRRKKRIPFFAAGALAMAMLLGGCDVDPYCLDCVQEGPPRDAGPDAGPIDARVMGRDSGPVDGGGAAGPMEDAGCAEGRTELCNDFDDDCDGTVDEGVDTDTDEENCGGCGVVCAPASAFGLCEGGECGIDRCDVGFFDIDGDPDNGCEYRCLPTAEDDTVCDFRDNDCDGEVDEDFDFDNDIDNCGSCARTCRFANAAASCVAGECILGDCNEDFYDIDERDATGCEYACTPADPATEVCNRRDDDCDGMVDEGDPGGGAPCGNDTGACVAGTERCIGGAIQCEGAVEESTETCNEEDDDCDGMTDEGFLSGDIRNCGSCGNVCDFDNGFAECRSMSCMLVACEDGFWDVDGDDSNGCEYECDFNGSEACNGEDDDCDLVVDEDLTPPDNVCDPNGVCGMGTVECDPAMDAWVCNLPATYEDTESTCDDLDNDCDGTVDESFLAMGLGTPCSNGVGACRRTGSIECTSDGMGVECGAGAPGPAGTEICDGLDNDCDGSVDEPRDSPGTNPSYVVEPMVEVTAGGPDFWIYQYEAARPSATDTSSGTSNPMTRACSRADVLPWTQVTYLEAEQACANAGLRLCSESEWERACTASSQSCTWSYASSCTTYNGNRCNGNDYDPDGAAGDQDRVLPTGSLPMCYANHGGGMSGRVFDMSGNVKEWTEARSAGVNPLRGGSMNNTRGGISCGFDFTVADDDFQFTNVGFRCCSDVAP